MPSVVEIFTVSGVAVGAGVAVLGAFKVSEVSEVCDVGAGVELDEGGVAALWQAARIKMERRSGMSFFMYISLSLRGGHLFFPTKQSSPIEDCFVGKEHPSSQ